MSEIGERFAREEMERDERMEMLIEDLGLEGPALEEYLRVHRQVEMELMMDELRGEEQFSSPAAQRTLDEIEKHVKNGRYFGQEVGREVVRLKPGNPKIRTLDDLFNILLECWCKETAYPSCQKDWSPDDPSYGQCAITAMLVHDLFGGTIHRIRNSGGGTHYFNKIGGRYFDLTAAQFWNYNLPLHHEPNEEMPRSICGRNPDTANRYKLLVAKIAEKVKSETGEENVCMS